MRKSLRDHSFVCGSRINDVPSKRQLVRLAAQTGVQMLFVATVSHCRCVPIVSHRTLDKHSRFNPIVHFYCFIRQHSKVKRTVFPFCKCRVVQNLLMTSTVGYHPLMHSQAPAALSTVAFALSLPMSRLRKANHVLVLV